MSRSTMALALGSHLPGAYPTRSRGGARRDEKPCVGAQSAPHRSAVRTCPPEPLSGRWAAIRVAADPSAWVAGIDAEQAPGERAVA